MPCTLESKESILPKFRLGAVRKFCGGVGCHAHLRVERASCLNFVQGTRKAFAAAEVSL